MNLHAHLNFKTHPIQEDSLTTCVLKYLCSSHLLCTRNHIEDLEKGRIPKLFNESDLMMGVVLAAKYSNPDILVVNVKINNTLISNILINLGASIEIMTRETMETLGLTSLRETPTVL
jgi:hypothetical protein